MKPHSFYEFFFISIWLITVDMLVISVVERNKVPYSSES